MSKLAHLSSQKLGFAGQMNVNEEIVKEWLHICKKQLTLTNIRFKVRGPKRGANYGDIDILAVDEAGHYYDYEVKWRSAYSLSAKDLQKTHDRITQILRQERLQKIRELIGEKPCHHVFVTTHQYIGKTQRKGDIILAEFRQNKIEVKFFENIVKDLVSEIETQGVYDSPISQTIRMLKYYGLTKTKP